MFLTMKFKYIVNIFDNFTNIDLLFIVDGVWRTIFIYVPNQMQIIYRIHISQTQVNIYYIPTCVLLLYLYVDMQSDIVFRAYPVVSGDDLHTYYT